MSDTDFFIPPVNGETPQEAQDRRAEADQEAENAEPLSVVPFPVLHPDALYGMPGEIVTAVAPHTEAHSAAILVQLLARFGADVGPGPHVFAANSKHPARLYPLILGKTSDGAKGTSWAVVEALHKAVERRRPSSPDHEPLRRLIGGLSSGEGLIQVVCDGVGDDPDAKGYIKPVPDKRLLVVEEEFVSVLAMAARQGNTLPTVLRAAWDSGMLGTATRSPLVATNAHIVLIGHATPGELKLKLKEELVVGGTMNRELLIASRRTRLLPDGGNIPEAVLHKHAGRLAEALTAAAELEQVERTDTAEALWRDCYPRLRRHRPDGVVASVLARAVPQVLRLSLVCALADGSRVIDKPHLAAALAVWNYSEATVEWAFGRHIDPVETEALLAYVAAGGHAGRTRTEISVEHYKKHRKSAEIKGTLGDLVADGRVRQEVDSSRPGPPVARYYAC